MKFNFSRLAIICVALLLLVSAASAWQISDNQHRFNGTVTFNIDGSGTLNADGYPTINFRWTVVNDVVKIRYLFYHVDVKYNSIGNYLYSDDIPNITLVGEP